MDKRGEDWGWERKVEEVHGMRDWDERALERVGHLGGEGHRRDQDFEIV